MVLVLVNPRLALYTSLAMPLIGLIAWRFAHMVMPISRQVQARKGDVTEAADEAVVGIEMVQAFGREDDVRVRFGDKARSVRDVVVRQAGVEAQHLPGLFFLPTLSIAAVLFFGGRDVIAGNLTIGEFVLFNTILLQLAWPLEALGWILNLAQRAVASAGRTFAWLEGIERLPEPDAPAALPPGPAGLSASPACGSPTWARRRCCAASTSTSSRVRSWRSAGRPGRARARCSASCRGSPTPTEGGVFDRRRGDPRSGR